MPARTRRKALGAAAAFAAMALTAASPASATRTQSPSPTPAQSPQPRTQAPVRPAAPPVGAADADNRTHLYTLEGFGGIHPAAGSPALNGGAYWPGWDIARSLAVFPDGQGAYVLDGFGGLHQAGTAPAISVADYWSGFDIARQVTLAPWSTEASPQGWVLEGFGGIHEFGGAPRINTPAYWSGWDIARGLAILPDSTPTTLAGYLLDGYGGLHPFGAAPATPGAAYFGWDVARGLTLLATSTHSSAKGYTLDGFGRVYAFGGLAQPKVTDTWVGWDIARGLTAWTGSGSAGGWVVDGFGGLHNFGNAPAVGGSAYWSGFDIARGVSGSASSSPGRRPVPLTRILPIPYWHQEQSLTCEAASLRMALANQGVYPSEQAIVNAIGYDLRAPYSDGSGFHWGDPYATFVGNPNGSELNNTGYGVYYPPVATVAENMSARVIASGEGIATTTVMTDVLLGHPVVAWVTYDRVFHSVSHYRAFDGRNVQFGSPYEHAVTVIGVNGNSLLINDPIRGQSWWSSAQFESSYATFNHMAVVIG